MTLPQSVSFNEHIQPILSEYCYHCHGPDAGTRKPEKEPLRLDIEAEAFKVRESGSPVIIKGNPAFAPVLIFDIHLLVPVALHQFDGGSHTRPFLGNHGMKALVVRWYSR